MILAIIILHQSGKEVKKSFLSNAPRYMKHTEVQCYCLINVYVTYSRPQRNRYTAKVNQRVLRDRVALRR